MSDYEECDADPFHPDMGWGAILGWLLILALLSPFVFTADLRDRIQRKP